MSDAHYLPLLLLTLACFACSGCTPGTPQTDKATASNLITATDDAGRTVSFPSSPHKIIPLAPNLTELLYAVGAGDQVAAVSLADDFPPQIDTLPKFSSFPVDYEALVALQPDVLVATDAINNPKDARQFISLGLEVMYYSFKTLDDIPRVMRELGKLTGNNESAERAAETIENRIQAVMDRVSDVEPVRALFLIGADQLYAFGHGNYIHEAIARAGGNSLTANIEAVSPILSEEFILTSRPDVILGTFRSTEQLLTHHPALKNVPAIANKRVCLLSPSLVLRPGPRIIEGIEAMAHCLHPALFTPSQATID